MTDVFTKKKRSKIMSRIRGKDTKPEKVVRSLLHRNGYRFRLHRKDLPGKPDIVLPKYESVIFVHGCYWHRHENCSRGQSMPSTNTDFWKEKFTRTIARDKDAQEKLNSMGWNVIVVWGCEISDPEALLSTLKHNLHQE